MTLWLEAYEWNILGHTIHHEPGVGAAQDVLNGQHLAIFIASRLAGFSHREIEEVFHLRSDSAVLRICQRTQANLDSNPELRRRMEKLGNLKG